MSSSEKSDLVLGPLAGVRVIDLGTMVAGPVAATLLADFGAEVIKVEQPKIGDTLRHVPPFANGESLWWSVDGRNKKSITLDLRQEKGQAVLRRLVKEADVVVENFRPGTLDRWNSGYEALSAVNSTLVMLSVSGFGQTGPLASRAGFDRIGLAFSGVMGLTGFPDRPPVRTGVSIADYTTALFGAFSVMMALYHRDARGGVGQQIDLALYESMFRFTETLIPAYDQLGVVRNRTGNEHYGASPGNNFDTRDGRFMTLTISTDGLFQRLCLAMGRPDMALEERYQTHAQRTLCVTELNEIVGAWIKSEDIDTVSAALDGEGIPFSIVLTAKDIVEHPHYLARENIATVPHPKMGTLKMPGVIPKMSKTPGVPLSAAPALGEHNRDIYVGLLGMQEAELEQLAAEGVI